MFLLPSNVINSVLTITRAQLKRFGFNREKLIPKRECKFLDLIHLLFHAQTSQLFTCSIPEISCILHSPQCEICYIKVAKNKK